MGFIWACLRRSFRLLTVLTLMASAVCTSQSLAPQEVSASELTVVAAYDNADHRESLQVEALTFEPSFVDAPIFVTGFGDTAEVIITGQPLPRAERAPPAA